MLLDLNLVSFPINFLKKKNFNHYHKYKIFLHQQSSFFFLLILR